MLVTNAATTKPMAIQENTVSFVAKPIARKAIPRINKIVEEPLRFML
jgi:hypothetical protein